jgi:hypothetical protein
MHKAPTAHSLDAKRLKSKTDRSPVCNITVKNRWNYNSTPPIRQSDKSISHLAFTHAEQYCGLLPDENKHYKITQVYKVDPSQYYLHFAVVERLVVSFSDPES